MAFIKKENLNKMSQAELGITVTDLLATSASRTNLAARLESTARNLIRSADGALDLSKAASYIYSERKTVLAEVQTFTGLEANLTALNSALGPESTATASEALRQKQTIFAQQHLTELQAIKDRGEELPPILSDIIDNLSNQPEAPQHKVPASRVSGRNKTRPVTMEFGGQVWRGNRGLVVKALSENQSLSTEDIARITGLAVAQVDKAIDSLKTSEYFSRTGYQISKDGQTKTYALSQKPTENEITED